MSKRTDLRTILVLGAGPIVIGQACEFDYAGSQACLALRKEGYRVILVNSNPATIMTDPQIADATYIEPMTVEVVKAIIQKERPDALLPTMGGQTALNLALKLQTHGVLAEFGVVLIGANVEAIKKAEDRALFHQKMLEIGLDLPQSTVARNMHEALEAASLIQFPIIIRSSFTLGGKASRIAHGVKEFTELCASMFKASDELILTEALIGWKEFEMEVVRDKRDNCIVVCTIENVDPLGVHTGDSITCAPCLTLTDKEYQKMRNASFAVLREVGVETGGANVQFAVHPKNGRMVIIEMNPRVSRSSALASKATGFPIAKIAALLAVGYTLDELKSDIVGSQIPASFEPVLDYVVVKMPVFQFEKFPETEDRIGPQMHSVGEVMAIGRTFSEALLKAMRSIEVGDPGTFDLSPSSKRLWHLFTAFRKGMPIEDVHLQTGIDCWFLNQIKALVVAEKRAEFSREGILELKQLGFSDAHIGSLLGKKEQEIRGAREKWEISPVFKRIDGTSGEFATEIAYAYATYEQFCEAKPSHVPKVMILGSGSNRIGQGIEFDYCCVHAMQALQEMGYETIMVNCNPETVSTDIDYADRLYCSPLTIEDLLPIIEVEKPLGVLLQYGGQTPLNLAQELEENGVPLLGINSSLIRISEDRQFFRTFLNDLQLKQPENVAMYSLDDPLEDLEFPVIVRPSFVCGGRGVVLAKDRKELEEAFLATSNYPVLVERYLHDALELDIDAISDGKAVFIPAIMEQVEKAGIHSGDSASYLPALRISEELKEELLKQTEKIALKLQIKGLINIQFAIEYGEIYVLEVNPRASRSVPFLSKAVGIDLVRMATRCIMGMPLENRLCKESHYFFVKEAVLPYATFGEIVLGPEMKSTGEVMGIGATYQEAYAKAQVAAGYSNETLASYSVRSLQELLFIIEPS